MIACGCCAQRLSASKKESPQISLPHSRKPCVLNAFRHRRRNHDHQFLNLGFLLVCSTPFGIEEGITHDLEVYSNAPEECSTPFGIEEGITDQNAHHLEVELVLNAFRHRRRNHATLLKKHSYRA